MKSHVSMEQQQCVVCGKAFDTGAILLHKRLKQTLAPHTVTGYGLCPKDDARAKDGYIALVECDPTTIPETTTMLRPAEAFRTGTILHIRRSVAAQLFNVPLPEGPVMFTSPDVVAQITALLPAEDAP